jgi:hypothetical protein
MMMPRDIPHPKAKKRCKATKRGLARDGHEARPAGWRSLFLLLGDDPTWGLRHLAIVQSNAVGQRRSPWGMCVCGCVCRCGYMYIMNHLHTSPGTSFCGNLSNDPAHKALQTEVGICGESYPLWAISSHLSQKTMYTTRE